MPSIPQKTFKHASTMKLVSPSKIPKFSTHDSTEFEFLVDSSLILPIKTVDGKSSMNAMKEYTSYDECEGDALLAVEAGLQEMFVRTVLQSPHHTPLDWVCCMQPS